MKYFFVPKCWVEGRGLSRVLKMRGEGGCIQVILPKICNLTPLPLQLRTKKYQEKVWNMFHKVNNKDIRTSSMLLLIFMFSMFFQMILLSLNRFHTQSQNLYCWFEQVNTHRVYSDLCICLHLFCQHFYCSQNFDFLF